MIEQESPPHRSIRESFWIVTIIGLIVILGGLAISLLTGCATHQDAPKGVLKKKQAHHTTQARITYYTGHHERVAMNGHRAVSGKTVAAHPKYHFNQKIAIPELYKYLGEAEYEVQDRGSAVTSRKASHKTADVFDIYVKNRKIMNWMGSHAPEYMTVEL